MLKALSATVVVVLGAALAAAYFALFIVHQNEQAIVLEFGKPVKIISEPGLYWKVPVVQTVDYFDKRILDLDTASQEVTASDQNSKNIFDRMRAERQREAAEARAEGVGASNRIKADADRQVTVIKADAIRDGERMRGDADAERNRIFADAFNRDPDFFAFYRSMQAYETGIKDTRMLLAPDSEFFKYFNSPSGNGSPSQPKR